MVLYKNILPPSILGHKFSTYIRGYDNKTSDPNFLSEDAVQCISDNQEMRGTMVDFIRSDVLPAILGRIYSTFGIDVKYFFLPRIICTLAEGNIPKNILTNIKGNERRTHGSLNTLVRSRDSDIFFFYDNPPHCDLIDMPTATKNFLTVLIPLTRRDQDYAPLFSENIVPSDKSNFIVQDANFPPRGVLLYGEDKKLSRVLPSVGDVIVWDALSYHAVKPNLSSKNVYNLRFNLAVGDDSSGVEDSRNIYKI